MYKELASIIAASVHSEATMPHYCSSTPVGGKYVIGIQADGAGYDYTGHVFVGLAIASSGQVLDVHALHGLASLNGGFTSNLEDGTPTYVFAPRDNGALIIGAAAVCDSAFTFIGWRVTCPDVRGDAQL